MVLLFNIIFWSALLLMLHTYVFFPFILSVRAKGKTPNEVIYLKEVEFPQVSVLMAAYNEELVIKDKMDSLLRQNYPSDKIRIYVGSDHSTDKTNDILIEYAKTQDNIVFIPFLQRTGKQAIINKLSQIAFEAFPKTESHIFLMTDASVILEENTIVNLIRHFKSSTIGLVDAHMKYKGMKENGISKAENAYLSREVKVKHQESLLDKKMIGPFGGCFALRSNLFEEVPTHYLVDDFFIAMNVLKQGYGVINDLEALCYEPVTHKIEQEYKRKKRISAGNFQNLFHFSSLLNPFTRLGYLYLSHKVIRWVGPFLIILLLLSSLVLALKGIMLFIIIFSLLMGWFVLLPLLDLLLKGLGIQVSLLRKIRYFNMMNWALLVGFFDFIKGIDKGIWEPTARS